MKITRLHTLVGLLTALAVALPFAAHADPVLTVTSPEPGSTFSRAFETIPVTGTVSFDAPPPVMRTFYFRRDACGSAAGANRRLSVIQGGETIGCGGLATAAQPITDIYPAIDGLPVVVDITKQAQVTVVEGAWVSGVGGGLGQETIQATLTGATLAGETKTLGTGTSQVLVTPAEDEVTHTVDLDLTDPGEVLTSLTLTVRKSGTLVRSYTSYAGASFLKLPILDIGSVQVSSDSASFSQARTVDAVIASDGTWSADVATPSVGERKLYVRAVQGAVKVNAEPIPVTIVP